MVMLEMETVSLALRKNTRDAVTPGTVTWTVTCVPLPALFAPSMVKDLVMESWLEMLMVATPLS